MRGSPSFVGGGELAELGDRGGNDFEGAIDFGSSSVATKTETNAGAGFGGGESNRGEDVRWHDRPGRAGRAGGASEALEIESNDESFAFDAGKSDVGSIGSAWASSAVGAGIGDTREKTLLKLVAQSLDTCGVFGERETREFSGFTQADDAGDIFRAGTKTSLMMAAKEKLAKVSAALDVNGADTLWGVQLVARERKKIKVERFDVDGNLAGGLHGIGVKTNSAFTGDAADLLERLNCAEFVVGVHHGDQNCLWPHGFAQII